MKIFDYFKDKQAIINEKYIICNNKKKIEDKFNDMINDLNTITCKYTILLEQKSEQFDLYIKYQNQCEELVKERREIKKNLGIANETITSQENEILDLNKKINKLEKQLEKCKIKN